MSKFYELEAIDINGKLISMDEFKGKWILVVNTASNCGFTNQYEGLELLHQKYFNKGLAVLGFPCNQFGKQEPGDEESIKAGCLLNYGVSFKMFSKIEVNGKNAHPIFIYLKDQLTGLMGSAIKWNFTKFLINDKGEPIKRFAPTDTPLDIEAFYLKSIK